MNIALQVKLARWRENFTKQGIVGERLERMLSEIKERHEVSSRAHQAYDDGIPQDQGPVWFDEEGWKTDFWQRQWECRKAYCEGEETRAKFGSRDENPYFQEQLPFTSRLIELEVCWRNGFDNQLEDS